MSYNSDKRPFEAASKANHVHIIKDKDIQSFLRLCEFPSESDEIEIDNNLIVEIKDDIENPIEHIVAIDGGDTIVEVKKKFPSSQISFFQFGASYLSISDLEDVSMMPFISPSAMSKLKELHRIKLVLPIKNIGLKIQGTTCRQTLTNSVRKALYDFFNKEEYLESLCWFLFENYSAKKSSYSSGARCPYCNNPYGDIHRSNLDTTSYTFQCQQIDCNEDLYLTDVFRLHEAIDDEFGAGGIIGYVRNLVEHFILIHTIKGVIENQPNALEKVLFIKDGPLGFFGQTANMHVPMRNLVNYALENCNLFLAGIEKSGPFVEHAKEISGKLEPSQALLLSNNYIYSHIKMGDPNTTDPFGRTSYYGSKIIFKSKDENVFVVTLPTIDEFVVMNPQKSDFINIDIILKNIERLRCDMYDNSLLPIALANKLVSISDHPSSTLLEKFAKAEINKG